MIKTGNSLLIKENKSSNDYEIQVGSHFKLNAKKKLGSGAFGEIYLGINTKKDQEVAIKLEPIKSKNPQLFYESKLYMSVSGGVGIPNVHWCGTQGNYNIMIIDLLGKSLEDLFTSCGRKFTLKSVIMLADQMLTRIEYIHSKDFIHRDIKPDNFMMGTGKDRGQVYIIDFGLGKRFKDIKTGLHIPFKDGKSLTGTARYCSINTHKGIEQSRRDDLESFAYLLVYFLQGDLPWQGLKAKNMKEKYEKIMEKKISTKLEDLCKGLPVEISSIINYTREIKFEEKPDYIFIKNKIKKIVENEKIEYDYIFDWYQRNNEMNEKTSKFLEDKKISKA